MLEEENMKNFLSKYWKKILIVIAAIFIIMNIVSKCVAPHVLISEYVEYGIEPENIVNIDANKVISSVTDEVKSTPLISEEMLKVCLILAGGLIIACIISDLTTKKAPAKKK